MNLNVLRRIHYDNVHQTRSFESLKTKYILFWAIFGHFNLIDRVNWFFLQPGFLNRFCFIVVQPVPVVSVAGAVLWSLRRKLDVVAVRETRMGRFAENGNVFKICSK